MNSSIRLRRFVLGLSLAAVTCWSISAAHGNLAEQPVVHLVAIGDLDVGMQVESDGSIKHSDFGRKVAEDAQHTVAAFEKAFAKAGKAEQLKTHLILGGDVNPEHILGVIAKLRVKKNDTLVVLYSGHGTMQPGKTHLLTCHHGVLPRQRLLDAMKAKSPRLMVLLTDCCSGNGKGIDAVPVAKQYEPKTMQDGEVIEWNTVNSLFLSHRGLVDLTAAEPGFPSKIDNRKPGSLFCNAFLRVLKTPHGELVRHLDKDRDGNLQWDELLPQLRGLASEYDHQQMRYLEATHGVNLSGVRPQQAYATSLGQWMPATQGTPR